MKRRMWCGVALSLSIAGCNPEPGDAAAIGIADRIPEEHSIHLPEEIEWRQGPESLEPGVEIAILEGDPAIPGPFTLRLRLPDGYEIAPHWHPNVERVTVISGVFQLGTGRVTRPHSLKRLEPGSYVTMPPGMRHFAVAEGETVIQITSVGPWQVSYVNPDDDPRERDPEEDASLAVAGEARGP